jgi:adenine-specific DNA-methyltransferase
MSAQTTNKSATTELVGEPCMATPWTLGRLLSAALDLGARGVPDWSGAERALLHSAQLEPLPEGAVEATREAILAGHDPLGDALSAMRSPTQKRSIGAIYTPAPIIAAMVDWAASKEQPGRVIDPGAGSCRFALAAGARFPKAELLAVESDPLSAIVGRANLSAAGLAGRAPMMCVDYRDWVPDRSFRGETLYVGNPPYVRHHEIEAKWKDWLADTASSLGGRASRLAGLHVHFFIATAQKATPGDRGVFITSSEWLDVNYGSVVRGLLLDGLGGESIDLFEPTAAVFEGVATTGVITCFRVGSRVQAIRVRRVTDVESLRRLAEGTPVSRTTMASTPRWTTLTARPRPIPTGFVELGEVCRVHRGTATGHNAVWILKPDAETDLPARVLFPCVTRAKELFDAGQFLDDGTRLCRAVDLPRDLNLLDEREAGAVARFLRQAEKHGATESYIARHRKPWWAVGLREPAPILATYMARRVPAFVRNSAGARHINIAHGLYPREPMSDLALDALADYLRHGVTLDAGRSYAGGLVKFEPREMERIIVPHPNNLVSS